MSDLKQTIIEKFRQTYNQDPDALVFAPGRVNLIGDHTDYNGGLVFPAALTMGTYLAIAQNPQDQWNFASLDKDTALKNGKAELGHRHHYWVDYPLGIIEEFATHGITLDGYNLLYAGNLPIGASLSSSASIELATALALNILSGEPFTMLELVKMAQHAENDFVEMSCGIMDQFASGFGKKDHAIALDCNTLDHEWVPLEMEGLAFVITNTNKPRELVDSAYNQRRQECEGALKKLQQRTNIQTLCELTVADFNALHSGLLDEKELQRARHTISEHARVQEAIQVLKARDMARFGLLMNASHDSLRNDYEVTCPELDFLVTTARTSNGVLGSRMTGAGFGGCTVTLLQQSHISEFIQQIGGAYQRQFNRSADFYIAEIGDGARPLTL